MNGMENIVLCVHRPIIELMSFADVNTAEAHYCKSQPEAYLDYYIHILKLNLFFYILHLLCYHLEELKKGYST